MANKTVQSLKISASWTPNAATSALMMDAIGNADLDGAKIGGGRIAIKHAIVADHGNPDHSIRVNRRIFAIKTALAATGELHSFNVIAGSVPASEAEVLPEPDADE